MGFSVSGATAVVFVGLLVSAATLYPTLDGNAERRHEAVDGKQERALALQNTAISVAGATYNASNDTLVATVDNDGSTSLSVDATDLLVDGVLVTDATTTVEGESRDVWASGDRLRFEVTLDSAPARVKVATEHGVAATAEVT